MTDENGSITQYLLKPGKGSYGLNKVAITVGDLLPIIKGADPSEYVVGWTKELQYSPILTQGKGKGTITLTNGLDAVVGVGTTLTVDGRYIPDSPQGSQNKITIILPSGVMRFLNMNTIDDTNATITGIYDKTANLGSSLGALWADATGEYEYYPGWLPMMERDPGRSSYGSVLGGEDHFLHKNSSYNAIFGFQHDVNNQGNFVAGLNNFIDAGYAGSIGTYNVQTGWGGFSAGEGLFSRASGEVAVGTYNTDYTPGSATSPSSGNRAFVVGIGSWENNRADGFAVWVDGQIEAEFMTVAQIDAWATGRILTTREWVSTGYVPYTGATANVDLNNKTLSNVASYNGAPLGLKDSIDIYSFYFGFDALSNATGLKSSAFGYRTLIGNTGTEATAFGYNTAIENSGTRATAFGSEALAGNKGDLATGLGYRAGYLNEGDYIVAVGNQTLFNNKLNYATAVGDFSLYQNKGTYATAYGAYSAQDNYGNYTSSFGFWSGEQNIGLDLTAIGRDSGKYNSKDNNTFLGKDAGGTYLEDTANNIAVPFGDIISPFNMVVTGHSFGAIGTKFHLKYTSTTGAAIVGLNLGQVDIWEVVDANTIKNLTSIFAQPTADTHTFTPQLQYENVTVIGANAIPNKSNQATLGDSNTVEAKLGNGNILETKLEHVINVAKSGGDFTSVKDALDSITDNDSTNRYVVKVASGIYIENNPIQGKEYVSVKAIGDLNTTRITALNPTADLITMSAFFTLQGFTFWGVTGASNYAINQSVPGLTSLTRCLIAECSNGILLNSATASMTINDCGVFNPTATTVKGVFVQAGALNINSFTGSLGIITTLLEVTGVNSVVILNGIKSTLSTLTTGISIKDLAKAYINGTNLTNMGTGIEAEGGAHVHLSGIRIENASVDGVRINDVGTDTRLNVQSTIVEGSTGYDFNLLSATSLVSGDASTSINKLNFIAGAKMYGTVLDLEEDDEGVNIIGELHVGLPEKGAESVFGEGDSYTRGMLVYSETELGAFTDRSASARSASGSPFTFDGVAAENAIYVASSLVASDALEHYGIKTEVITATVKGAGDIIIEYWNGSIWVEVNGMEVDSDGKYYPHANNYFQDVGDHQIRYSSNLATDSWTKSDPMSLGTEYYWVRFRITTAITTAPIFEQFKLHTNRFETNAGGWVEYFGKARPIGVLPWDLGLVEAANASPGNQDIFLSDNLGVGRVENLFLNTATDRIGFNSYLPLDLDTSSPILIKFSVITNDASAGDIDWVVRWGYSNDTLNVYGTTASAPTTGVNEQNITQSLPAPTAADIQKTYELSLDVKDMVSRRESGFGDILWVTIQRTSGDTHAGDVAMINFQAFYTKWCEGGHI